MLEQCRNIQPAQGDVGKTTVPATTDTNVRDIGPMLD